MAACVVSPCVVVALHRLDLETVQKDISSLTTEEKLEILTAEAPELLGLVQDFRAKITLMRERVFPLIQRYRTRRTTRAHLVGLPSTRTFC